MKLFENNCVSVLLLYVEYKSGHCNNCSDVSVHMHAVLFSVPNCASKIALLVIILHYSAIYAIMSTPLHASSNFTPVAECICTACK
jgi:hypothetical protein